MIGDVGRMIWEPPERLLLNTVAEEVVAHVAETNKSLGFIYQDTIVFVEPGQTALEAVAEFDRLFGRRRA